MNLFKKTALIGMIVLISACRQGGSPADKYLYQTDHIKDNEVITKKIKDSSINTYKIKDESILSNDIKDESIVSADIKNQTIQAVDIHDQAITSEKLHPMGAQQVGEVLIWDGTKWVANTQGPWFLNGRVGIGLPPAQNTIPFTIESQNQSAEIIFEAIHRHASSSTVRITNRTNSTALGDNPILELFREGAVDSQTPTPNNVLLGAMKFSGTSISTSHFIGAEIASKLTNNTATGGATDLFLRTSDGSTTTAQDQVTITSGGKVGVGTTNPQTKLEVAGGVKIGTETTCDANHEGTMQYNSNLKNMEFCNGSNWVPLNQPTGYYFASGYTNPPTSFTVPYSGTYLILIKAYNYFGDCNSDIILKLNGTEIDRSTIGDYVSSGGSGGGYNSVSLFSKQSLTKNQSYTVSIDMTNGCWGGAPMRNVKVIVLPLQVYR